MQDEVFRAIGIDPDALANDPYIKRLQNILDDGQYQDAMGNTITIPRDDTPQNNALLQQALDNVMSDWSAGRRFAFTSDAQVQQVYDAIIQTYENTLDSKLGAAVATLAHNSHEYAALLSLTYNNPALIGPGLVSSIQSGDRANAWYEIRYRSNADAVNAQRRYAESEHLGLYNNSGAFSNSSLVGEDEAKTIFQMYAHYRGNASLHGTISWYENKYSSSIAPANIRFAPSLQAADLGPVHTLTESLAPAMQKLPPTPPM